MKKHLLSLVAVFAACVCTAAEVNILTTDFKGDKLPDSWSFNTYKTYLPLTTIVDAGEGVAFCDAPAAGTSFFTRKMFVVGKDTLFRVRITAKGNGSFKIGSRCYTAKWAFAGAKFQAPQALTGEWKTYEFQIAVPVFPNKDAVERMGIQIEFPANTELQLRNITIDKVQ